MDADPRDGFTRLVSSTNWREQRTVRLDLTVTIHASLRGRQVRHAGLLYVRVAIAAVEPEFVHVKCMAVRYRLNRRVSNPCILRCRVVIGRRSHSPGHDNQKHDDLERQAVGRFREDFRHEPVVLQRLLRLRLSLHLKRGRQRGARAGPQTVPRTRQLPQQRMIAGHRAWGSARCQQTH